MFYSYLAEHKNTIYCKKHNDDGSVEFIKDKDFVIELFVESVFDKSQYTSFMTNLPLKRMTFGTIAEYKNFVRNNEEGPIYGELSGNTICHQYIRNNNLGGFDKDFSQLDGLYFDIECLSEFQFPHVKDAKYPVSAISLISSKTLKTYVFALFDEKKLVEDTPKFKKIRMFKNRFPEYENTGNFGAIEEEINRLLKTVEDKDVKSKLKGHLKFLKFVKDIEIQYFSNDRDLLEAFVLFIEKYKPDFLSGWNIESFDIPYILTRLGNLFEADFVARLSPFNRIIPKTVEDIKGNKIASGTIVGILEVDYMLLYQKYIGKNMPSWSLDYISEEELGYSKLEHEESFYKFYCNNFQEFIEYNIIDTKLVFDINEKKDFMNVAFAMVHLCYLPFHTYQHNTVLWDGYICWYLRKENKIIPPMKRNVKERVEGAYNKVPISGMYHWVVSFDLKSLYPHLIMQFNISPETFVSGVTDKGLLKYQAMAREKISNVSPLPHSRGVDYTLENKIDYDYISDFDLIMTPSGSFFRKDKKGLGYILMDSIYNLRTEYQKIAKENYEKAEVEKDPTQKSKNMVEAGKANTIQYTLKIFLNSFYGAFLSDAFRYYNPRVGESITSSGQLSIRFIIDYINKYLNNSFNTKGLDFVIGSSTDSMYIDLSKYVENNCKKEATREEKVKLLVEFCDGTLAKVLNKGYAELSDRVKAFENKMMMNREVISDSGFWLNARMYVLRVFSDEKVKFYAKPKVKIVGHPIVKASIPRIVKPEIRKILDMILDGANSNILRKEINSYWNVFKGYDYRKIAVSVSVTDIDKFEDYDVRETALFETMSTYKKGDKGSTPIHSRGCILFNNLVDKYKLGSELKISESSKVKYIYLKKSNPLGENVIAFQERLPKVFGLDSFIDYPLMFEKSFEKIINDTMKALGMNIKGNALF